MYKILALDLDGTLTNSKKEITPHTLDVLIKVQQKGIRLVLASGRPIPGIMPLAEQLHLKEYGGFILAFNGGLIIDCASGEPIYQKDEERERGAPGGGRMCPPVLYGEVPSVLRSDEEGQSFLQRPGSSTVAAYCCLRCAGEDGRPA